MGEKLLEFTRRAGRHPEYAAELPKVVAAIRRGFAPEDLREYLDNVRRVGTAAHVTTDEQYEVMRAAGALDDDIVRGAEDVILMGQIREMLLEESEPPHATWFLSHPRPRNNG